MSEEEAWSRVKDLLGEVAAHGCCKEPRPAAVEQKRRWCRGGETPEKQCRRWWPREVGVAAAVGRRSARCGEREEGTWICRRLCRRFTPVVAKFGARGWRWRAEQPESGGADPRWPRGEAMPECCHQVWRRCAGDEADIWWRSRQHGGARWWPDLQAEGGGFLVKEELLSSCAGVDLMTLRRSVGGVADARSDEVLRLAAGRP